MEPLRQFPVRLSLGLRVLRIAFVIAVAAFAWLRFSENTVDNDLWGHVIYGQRAWLRGGLEFSDTLSWTAAGAPWINHEFVAEIVMGQVHRLAGGTGLWLLMIGFAAVTVGLALREGRGTGGLSAWCSLGLFVFSINAIATGYAVRPQLFSMLALVLLIFIMCRIDRGSVAWGAVIPFLFLGWVNTHGGFLAGLVVVSAASVAYVAQVAFEATAGFRSGTFLKCRRHPIVWLLLPVFAFVGTLSNPWGWRMIEWTVASVLLPRPNIVEWHSLGFSLAGLVLIAVMLATLWSWCFSRRPNCWWEATVLFVLAVMALRSQRHTPLFALANLMLTPVHLADALQRFARHGQGLVAAFRRPALQWAAASMLVCAAVYAGIQSGSYPRIHPFTLEVERDVFPESAVTFISENRLTGNTITFFDWGQYVLWKLPDNPVSFDGRLDTVYSAAIMDAHWRLYAGKDPGPALDLTRAEIALIPSSSPGADWLRSAGWTTVYRDDLAEVLLRRPQSFPLLDRCRLPFIARSGSIAGRSLFPSTPSVLASRLPPR